MGVNNIKSKQSGNQIKVEKLIDTPLPKGSFIHRPNLLMQDFSNMSRGIKLNEVVTIPVGLQNRT